MRRKFVLTDSWLLKRKKNSSLVCMCASSCLIMRCRFNTWVGVRTGTLTESAQRSSRISRNLFQSDIPEAQHFVVQSIDFFDHSLLIASFSSGPTCVPSLSIYIHSFEGSINAVAAMRLDCKGIAVLSDVSCATVSKSTAKTQPPTKTHASTFERSFIKAYKNKENRGRRFLKISMVHHIITDILVMCSSKYCPKVMCPKRH